LARIRRTVQAPEAPGAPGLTDHEEVVEVAVVDVAGRVVFDTLIKPAGVCSEDAWAIHGISELCALPGLP
jgi:hypothetical protein